jgi:hypothetical protein
MTQEELNSIDKLLKNCRGLEAEMKEMNRCKEFLINEYKTNKRWFRLEPGKVTIEDVIKASFEFGWSSRRNFDYDRERKATTD